MRYIIVNIPHNGIDNLGHEISFSRKVLAKLLEHNYVTKDDCVVTLNDDRKFLYTNLINNVLSYNEFSILNISPCNIIRLTPELFFLSNNPLRKFISINNLSLPNNIYDNYITPNFMNLLTQVNYDIPIPENIQNIIKSNFIIIHIRHECHSREQLEFISNYFYNKNIKTIVFTNTNLQLTNAVNTNNLQLYAKLMNLENCRFVLSEWSGGGQVTQFCCNSYVFYYHDNYPELYFNEKTKEYEDAVNASFFEYFDHFVCSNVKRTFISNELFKDRNYVCNLLSNVI